MQALLKVAQQSGLLQRAGAAALPLVSGEGAAMGGGGSQAGVRARPPAVIGRGDAARAPAARLPGPPRSPAGVKPVGGPLASGYGRALEGAAGRGRPQAAPLAPPAAARTS